MKMLEGKPATSAPDTKLAERHVEGNGAANLEDLKATIKELEGVVANVNDKTAGNVYDSRSHARIAIEYLLAKFLSGFNISHGRTAKSLKEGDGDVGMDYASRTHFVSGNYVLENMRRMLTLEEKDPGAVQFLYSQRGIRNFARYSAEFWARQYTESASTLPYMLVITPSGVERGTAAGSAIYKTLQNDLKKLEASHLMRTIEVSGLSDMLRLLVRLDKAHNADGTNPIKLVLFDGHGTNVRLFLQWGGRDSKLHAKDILSERFAKIFQQYLSKAFAPTAQFIFGSCESALPYKEHPAAGVLAEKMPGIAHSLKEVLKSIFSKKVRIVGSEDELTPFTHLTPSLLKGGSLSLACATEPYEEERYDAVKGKYLKRTKRPRLKKL